MLSAELRLLHSVLSASQCSKISVHSVLSAHQTSLHEWKVQSAHCTVCGLAARVRALKIANCATLPFLASVEFLQAVFTYRSAYGWASNDPRTTPPVNVVCGNASVPKFPGDPWDHTLYIVYRYSFCHL